ncbi:MAG: hypothetical protein NT178_14855 [Proteobacteria bacterium]|nr:hypothetical protein [Pseudomonadota bacterium]
MLVSYCFSSPEGDVPIDTITLERPFIMTPFENHPFMTLGDYFAAVRGFILLDNGQHLVHLLAHLWDKKVEIIDIEKIIIRYEKYGTLYQIVSAEVFSQDQQEQFSVSTAISGEAKETLNREFDLIQHLYYQKGLPYLPRAYYRQAITLIREEMSETILMTMSQWFENYHEWHFSKDDNNVERIIIWDMNGGYRFASDYEVHEIIRQASKILTLYYNSDTYCRIYPWHHGAGDFVVKTVDGIVDVRLVTVRGYEPIELPSGEERVDPLKALMLFLFDITIKMRLDKLEGVGEPYWVEASILKAVLEGFLDALRKMEFKGDCPGIKIDVFIDTLKSMNENKMRALFSSCIDQYRIHDPSDYTVIQKHINSHAVDVQRIFQNCLK